jgi:hypothetical protein
MIGIHMNYYHTPIANRSWKRRREREIIRTVTGAVVYALMPRPHFPHTEAQFDCKEGSALTPVRVFVDAIDEDTAKRIVLYLNNNKNVYARLHTNPEPATIPA